MMSKKYSSFVISFAILASASIASDVSAQTAATATTPQTAVTPQTPPRKVVRRVQTPPARVTVIPSDSNVAPQVVTIIHRLSGVKILRLLLRQNGESIVETLDPETLTNDAHASIIAGWAMDDGKTIAARLPQAAAEIEVTELEKTLPEMKARAATTEPLGLMRPRIEPDLTVITADGRKLRARLIGLDAETGLSILQVAGLPPVPPPKIADIQLKQGQSIEIFAPEPATPEAKATTRNTYVRVEKTDATVTSLAPNESGSLEKLIVRGAKLSPDVIGGVACDQTGSTIGIIESIDGDSASIVGTERVRAATRRVLERQASVPRPLLGVRGEPVDAAAHAAFLAHGWRDDQVRDLIKEQVGILLTSVVPKTPAALAKLQPGDVILRVNQTEVKSAEDFSKLLGEAGSGEQVQFTIRRPDTAAPLLVPVTLGGSFAPIFERRVEFPRMPTPFFGLQQMGIQTMAWMPRATGRIGGQNGFIVLAVQADSAAARGGLREGDVIEAIDGKTLTPGAWTFTQQFASEKKHTFSIIRAREKKQVVVETKE
jgi:S1-C subfamily serine protease